MSRPATPSPPSFSSASSGRCSDPSTAASPAFIYRPRQVVDYLRELLKLRPPHYIGHNPAGAAMIFALFAVLTGLVVTGFIVQGGQEKQGAFAGLAGFALGNNVRGIHNFLAYLLMAMIAAHIAGVVADGRLHKSSLVRAMITGWKRVPAQLPVRASRARRGFRRRSSPWRRCSRRPWAR